MKKQSKSYGYYYVSLSLPSGRQLMRTNDERAFIISQLQDLLSPRFFIDSVPAHKQLASCIDLLAFSLTCESVQLVVFTIDRSVITSFTEHLRTRLTQYQDEYRRVQFNGLQEEACIRTRILSGPHQALARSVELHMCHTDWEFDRYSSIGFYLHDRRGDWMRTWRLATLYDNNALNYRLLIDSKLTRASPDRPTKLQTFVS